MAFPQARDPRGWSVKLGAGAYCCVALIIAIGLVMMSLAGSQQREARDNHDDCRNACVEALWPNKTQPSRQCNIDCYSNLSKASIDGVWHSCVKENCNTSARDATMLWDLPVLISGRYDTTCNFQNFTDRDDCRQCGVECWNTTGLMELEKLRIECSRDMCNRLAENETLEVKPCHDKCAGEHDLDSFLHPEFGTAFFAFILVSPIVCCIGNLACGLYQEAAQCDDCISRAQSCLGRTMCIAGALLTLVTVFPVLIIATGSADCLTGRTSGSQCAGLGFLPLLYIYFVPSMLIGLALMLVSRCCFPKKLELDANAV